MDIVLALGGGGARGNAHLGVIRALEKEGFQIKAVAGTSAGGIVAGVYSAGYSPQEIIDRFSSVNQSSLYSLGGGPSLLGVKGIVSALQLFLDEETFDDLRIPCALTAVDIDSMREVVLKEGKVLDAIMATIAIPGVFPPQKWGDHKLVDGGVLDPVPVEVARSLAPGIPVVAVSLSPPKDMWSELPAPNLFSEPPLLKPISNLRVAQAFEIFIRSVELGTHMLSETRLEIEQPDLIIRPDVCEIGPLDKVDVREIASRGDRAVEAVLPELRQLVRRKGLFSRIFPGK